MASPRNSLPPLIEESNPAAGPRRDRSRDGSSESRSLRRLAVGGASVLVILVSIVIAISTLARGNDAGEASRRRVLIDSVTGEVFENFRIREGSVYPVRNPKTGTETLYPAEACYWNADGTAKIRPTWVFVNAGESGDTLCPECNRKVVPHNPTPPDHLMVEAMERHRQSAGG